MAVPGAATCAARPSVANGLPSEPSPVVSLPVVATWISLAGSSSRPKTASRSQRAGSLAAQSPRSPHSKPLLTSSGWGGGGAGAEVDGRQPEEGRPRENGGSLGQAWHRCVG